MTDLAIEARITGAAIHMPPLRTVPVQPVRAHLRPARRQTVDEAVLYSREGELFPGNVVLMAPEVAAVVPVAGEA